MMIHTKIKEATTKAHQTLEKTVVYQLKQVRSERDYAEVLKSFYVYFQAVEQAIAPFIDANVLPDMAERRNSTYLKTDLEELEAALDQLPTATAPRIVNVAEAFGALYVLEGSIMGGPYIVQMLKKYGMDKGFHFFSGYGAESGKMWEAFTTVLNAIPKSDAEADGMIAKANETFELFGSVFAKSEAALG